VGIDSSVPLFCAPRGQKVPPKDCWDLLGRLLGASKDVPRNF
jgi:hypothetical protein